MKFTATEILQISAAVDAHVVPNGSQKKVVLTVGEALLMLIKACKKAGMNAEIILKLKKLYLEGVKSEDDSSFISDIKNLFSDKKQYSVSSDPQIINEDPSRRYFETHLAHRMLGAHAEGLNTEKLQAYSEKLKIKCFILCYNQPRAIKKIQLILKGSMDSSLDKYQLEYAELIHKLKKHDFHGLSPQACNNLLEIAKITILSTLLTQYDSTIPANIYADSIFNMGADGRGRKLKQGKVLSSAKGIIRSTTPLPRNDIARDGAEVEYDVPLSHEGEDETPIMSKREKLVTSPFTRSADQATFMIESQWCQHLFGRQTQVYSNGISSTTLAMLRNTLQQKREGNPFHSDYFKEFINVFAGLMIYNSGGHSLFEIFEVFKLPQLREIMEASGCAELLDRDELMTQWLLEDQPEVFDRALNETIDYAQTVIHRRITHAQLKRDTLETTLETTFHAEEEDLLKEFLLLRKNYFNLLSLTPVAFQEALVHKIASNPGFNFNVRNPEGYTIAMVAAQAGMLEHIKILAELKLVDFRHETNSLTALELAIKNEKWPVVDYLLQLSRSEQCAPIKRQNVGNLKERAPALYYACRQKDTRILEAVIKSGLDITVQDIYFALEEAVKVENVDAVKKIITLLGAEVNVLSNEDRQKILDAAAERGNLHLVNLLLSSPIAQPIDYNSMLLKAYSKNYVPMVRLILSEAQKNGVRVDRQKLNGMMITALVRHQYDLAILAIIYGADMEKINYGESYLAGFMHYLRRTPPEYFKAFFTAEDRALITHRAESIRQIYVSHTTGIWRTFINLLVRFLSILPGVSLETYHRRTEVITRIMHKVVPVQSETVYEQGYDGEPSLEATEAVREGLKKPSDGEPDAEDSYPPYTLPKS